MTPNAQSLEGLIERVKAAQGSDREIDASLFIALVEPTWHTSPKDPGAVAADKQYFWPEGKLKYLTRNSKVAPQYTASIDAALALVERCLPGWSWNIGHDANDELHATLWHGVTEHDEYAATAPLAIILALLTAMQEQNNG